MRSPVDRRSEEDRREAHHLDYLLNGGTERRSGKERRSRVERRSGWVRAGQWYSICLSFVKRAKNLWKI
jgi:hypothetical protein